MSKKYLSLICAAALAIGFMSCGEEKKDDFLTDREDTKDTIKQEVQAEFAVIRSKIPQPNELGKKFAAAGISYNKAALLPSGKESSYSSRYNQAIGLGAFGADLGFACSYNQSQDALQTLNSIAKLANDLGVSSAFDKTFASRILQNLTNADSLDALIEKANDKAERNMRSNQRVQSAVLMICGGWIEGMYVAAEHLKSKKDDKKAAGIYKEIYIYASSYEDIQLLLDSYKGNADIDKFQADVKDFWPNLKGVGNHPDFSPAMFDNFYTAISALRAKLLN